MLHRVIVPETDLRMQPVAGIGYQIKDFDQLTQLTEGERVRILETNGDWARVEAIDQPRCSLEGAWQGYAGWVLLDHLAPCLSERTERSAMKPFTLNSILSFATPFLGTPYFGGGASLIHPERPRTGVDCSGLSMLLYRAHGYHIPRDAHDQYLQAVPREISQLRPGDLVFSSKLDGSGLFDHVMIYVEKETVLEASFSFGSVRLVSFQEKFGLSLADILHGQHPSAVRLAFGAGTRMLHRVIVPEADLRKRPVAGVGYQIKDPDQLTQLTEGERVRILETNGDWARVEAIDQPWCNSEGTWQGYSGWVLLDHLAPSLSENTQHSAVKPLTPKSILTFATPFLGTPYFWGGASTIHPERPRTGVDCSGLSMLLYRAHGHQIPRDAHDQYLQAVPREVSQLCSGDLVFTSKPDGNGRIDHVMVYVEQETLLEASLSFGFVRLVSFQEKLGVSLADIRRGERPQTVRLICGQASRLASGQEY